MITSQHRTRRNVFVQPVSIFKKLRLNVWSRANWTIFVSSIIVFLTFLHKTKVNQSSFEYLFRRVDLISLTLSISHFKGLFLFIDARNLSNSSSHFSLTIEKKNNSRSKMFTWTYDGTRVINSSSNLKRTTFVANLLKSYLKTFLFRNFFRCSTLNKNSSRKEDRTTVMKNPTISGPS